MKKTIYFIDSKLCRDGLEMLEKNNILNTFQMEDLKYFVSNFTTNS